MSRVGSEDDLYRRVQNIEDELRKSQQGILQGQFNPLQYRPCDYAATSNVTLGSAFASITDVAPGTPTLASAGGMRILLTFQTNQVENGIYVVNSIDGFLSRATDMPYGAIVKTGARISVLNGYQFGDATFSVQGTLDKTVGNNPITMSVTGRGGTAVADIVPFSGYWTHYDTVGAPSNSFGKMEVVRIPNGLCTMRGLFKQLVAWNGASSPTFTNMFQLPVGFRPGTWLMGWVHMQDTAAQRYDGPCNMDPAGMLSLRYPEMIGTSNGNQSFGMFLFNAWQALA